MANIRELSEDKKDKVHKLFSLMINAVNPGDFGGHLPNCGYTNEIPVCGCMEFGRRLSNALVDEISKWKEVGDG